MRTVFAAAAVGVSFVLAGLGGVAGGPILCPLRAFTGVPCPFCGMTTSFVATASGDLAGAFTASPLGPPLWVACIAIAIVSAALLARRRRITIGRRLIVAATAVGAPLMAGLWIYQLWRIGPLSNLL